MDAVTLLNQSIETAHWVAEGTLNGVDDALCHKLPGGQAHPISALYAHMVGGEDFLVQTMLAGKPPLAAGEWAGKTGISEPPPGPEGDALAWAQRVKVDLDQTRKYAAAVYENTKKYVASLAATTWPGRSSYRGSGRTRGHTSSTLSAWSTSPPIAARSRRSRVSTASRATPSRSTDRR